MFAVLHVLRIKKLNTSSYHPQTNGLTERFNQTLKAMLTHYTKQNQKDWDRSLPYVLYAYRTSPHSITGHSPFYLVYGREATYPFDIMVNHANSAIVEELSADEDTRRYVNELILRLNVAHTAVSETAGRAQERREESNNQLQNVPYFPINSLVLLYTPQVKPQTVKKLTPLWKGPYKVKEIFNNQINYVIHKVTKKGEEIKKTRDLIVHASRLRKYNHPDSSIIRYILNRDYSLV